MNCKHAKDLILTDYIDGRMGREEVERLQTHLEQCRSCRELEAAARETAGPKWSGMPWEKAPREIWQNVKAMIQEEQPDTARGSWSDAWSWERLKDMVLPHPRLILVSALSVILVGVFLLKFLPGNKLQNREGQQMEYLVSLMGGEDTDMAVENGGYGTDIEAVFLQS